MAKSISDHYQKQIEKDYKKDLVDSLQTTFTTYIYKYGERLAKIKIVEDKDAIINETIDYIYTIFDCYGHKKYSGLNETIIFIDLENIYANEIEKAFKVFKLKQKAIKDYYKVEIYNHIVKDIANAMEQNNIYNILQGVKTLEYKKAVMDDILRDEEDTDIFNDIYNNCLNKAVKEFKQLEKDFIENEKEKNKFKIPLGWKLAGITTIINKLVK